MRHHARLLWAASSLIVSSALAQNPATQLPPPLKLVPTEALARAIAAAKLDAPQVASGVETLTARADELDRRKRGRFAAMTPLFRGLVRDAQGHPALLLLEPLIFPERFTQPQSPTAVIALRAGLIEAAGDLKDAAAVPLYRQLLNASDEFYTVRAAAEALGKLALEPDVAALSKLALTAGPKQDAVIAGLGSCRRVPAAVALSTLVASQPDTLRAKRIAQSLGLMGSAWVMAVPHAVPDSEIVPLQTATARAAVQLYVSATSREVRDAASDAVMAIDAPDTLALVTAEMRRATPEGQAALGELTRRFEHNPTRGVRP